MKTEKFKLRMNSPFLAKKGHVISSTLEGQHRLKVVKVYRINWWKSLLMWLGIKRDWFIGIKVKKIK